MQLGKFLRTLVHITSDFFVITLMIAFEKSFDLRGTFLQAHFAFNEGQSLTFFKQ